MWSPLWVIYFVVVIAGWLVQLSLAVGELRRARELSLQAPGHWPLSFPVYLTDYYAGRFINKFFHAFSIAGTTLLVALIATDWLLTSTRPEPLQVFPVVCFVTCGVRILVPKLCKIDDRGVEFETLFPWDHVHRFSLNERRLLLVVERPTNRTMMQHVEIPLNGLPSALRPSLERELSLRIRALNKSA
jgi:hypothetical protein